MFHKGMRRTKATGQRRTLGDMNHRELVKLLDEAYSTYRRMVAADDNGICHCVTCGKIAPWKEMDLGHYITRAIMATRWDDHNTAVQCPKCNRYMGGLQHLMREHLVMIYGLDQIEALELRSKMGGKETRDSLLYKVEMFRKLIKNVNHIGVES